MVIGEKEARFLFNIKVMSEYDDCSREELIEQIERLKRENKANTEQTANSAQEIEHHA